MGVITAHFPCGDQIIAHFHSIFILVQATFLRRWLISIAHVLVLVGVTTTHFPGGDRIGFSLTPRWRPLMIGEVKLIIASALLHLVRVTWSLTPVRDPVPNEDRT